MEGSKQELAERKFSLVDHSGSALSTSSKHTNIYIGIVCAGPIFSMFKEQCVMMLSVALLLYPDLDWHYWKAALAILVTNLWMTF